ncbi:MAG: hypothetical protein ACREIA_15915 [Opitutaceae bacterium]
MKPGDTADDWTLMAVIATPGGTRAAVFEDFTRMRGHILVTSPEDVIADLRLGSAQPGR